MKMRTSLGDFISALYDTVDPAQPSRSSEIVAACTYELLLRQRKSTVIAELFDPSDVGLLN